VLEDRLRAHPLISQCLVVGDGRPFIAALITLDPEAVEFWRKQHGRPEGADVTGDPELIADVQRAVDDANKAVSRAESIRSFRILASDFTEANGYLTPSLKVKRNVVLADYADDIDAIYAKRP
jgi:long-chain acyl-CoA synthetase